MRKALWLRWHRSDRGDEPPPLRMRLCGLPDVNLGMTKRLAAERL
jgi:hypothetical protein